MFLEISKGCYFFVSPVVGQYVSSSFLSYGKYFLCLFCGHISTSLLEYLKQSDLIYQPNKGLIFFNSNIFGAGGFSRPQILQSSVFVLKNFYFPFDEMLSNLTEMNIR